MYIHTYIHSIVPVIGQRCLGYTRDLFKPYYPGPGLIQKSCNLSRYLIALPNSFYNLDACVHVCVYACMCVCIVICMHIYVCMYIHTYKVTAKPALS